MSFRSDAESAGAIGRPWQSFRDEAARPVVLVGDAQDRTARRVTAVAELCGADVRVFRNPFDSVVDADARCALIAGNFPIGDQDGAFDGLRQLSANGMPIIAYAQGTAAWPLSARCRWFLAGATNILDYGQPDFELRLSTALKAHIDTNTAADDDERLRELMASMGVVSQSRGMLEVFRRVEKVGRLSELTALIVGESGTGKELLARAIHRLDPKRRERPFVPLNCAAISSALAESELFGYKRGAFTGAARDHRGLFRAADGGVLFLDEIGELSLELQAKLLRTLQERRVMAVGDDREAAIDVRVIAATHRSLPAMVAEGTFREDLFHRLNVAPVEVPPLRERREDLQPLVKHFLAAHAPTVLGRMVRLAPDFVEAIATLELPGNVRELENLVRQSLLNKCGAEPLCLGDLPPQVWRQISGWREVEQAVLPGIVASKDEETASGAQGAWMGLNLKQSLERCERLILKTALSQSGNNQSRAAKLLGITPRTIYNMLRRHDLSA